MRVLVCGGRDYGEVPRDLIRATWGEYARERAAGQRRLLDETLSAISRPDIIIHGAATGADEHARRWAVRNGIPETGQAFKANWYPNGQSGGMDKKQGPIRNQRMIDEGKPDLVIAFPGKAGTADMVRRARLAGIEVRVILPAHSALPSGETA